MAYSPKGVMDIFEILTRWHSGYTISGIADALGIDRKTVRRFDSTYPNPDLFFSYLTQKGTEQNTGLSLSL